MAYQKFLVDNPKCQRRFHLAFDDEAAPVAHTEVTCSFCGDIVFSAEQHQPVQVLRQENLTKTTALARKLMRSCSFKDDFVNAVTGQPSPPKPASIK